MQEMVTCLLFETEAAEAAKFYTSIFKKSKLGKTTYYGNEGREIHGRKAGTVLTVEFQLNGMKFVTLNGYRAPASELISFQVMCDTQKEVDHYWTKLTQGGGAEVQCGWLRDKYGVSWQIVPKILGKFISGKDRVKADRAMKAMMQMKKIDIKKIEEAVRGRELAKAGTR